jgi:hypothetical protein
LDARKLLILLRRKIENWCERVSAPREFRSGYLQPVDFMDVAGSILGQAGFERPRLPV